MRKKKGERRAHRSVGLNLILWISFLLFAILLIVVFTLVQNYELNRRYREQIADSLQEAAFRLRENFAEQPFVPAKVSALMLAVTNEYNVSAYLFSEDDVFIFPNLPEGQDGVNYREVVALVRKRIEVFVSEMVEEGKEVDITDAQAQITMPDSAGYALAVRMGDKIYYLYLTSSFEMLHRLSSDMMWYSLITALFAVALSFVGSGFVSMILARPVTEVTERAKELARGNYEIKSERTYFCTEVNDLSKALDYAGEEISRTDKMQKELIANVSHDFKTPLTMIKAYAAMIREISGNDPEKREKHTQIIIDEADRLAALVGDVLDLSRLQAGMEEAERTVFNLSDVVYAVVGRFGYLTETQGYSFDAEIDEDVYTYAGKARVEQVLYNLIGNAVNYTGEDKKVVVRLSQREKSARFEVLDSGKGIPPEELDTIWERYYRTGEAHKRPVQGTGLGLAIVKSVLVRYAIPFGVESEQGKGSCFWVEFPLPPDEK